MKNFACGAHHVKFFSAAPKAFKIFVCNAKNNLANFACGAEKIPRGPLRKKDLGPIDQARRQQGERRHSLPSSFWRPKSREGFPLIIFALNRPRENERRVPFPLLLLLVPKSIP
jgi:hypothetical protein